MHEKQDSQTSLVDKWLSTERQLHVNSSLFSTSINTFDRHDFLMTIDTYTTPMIQTLDIQEPSVKYKPIQETNMKLRFHPVLSSYNYSFSFDQDAVHIQHCKTRTTLDFSFLGNGEEWNGDSELSSDITKLTALFPILPILSAHRQLDGVLWLELVEPVPINEEVNWMPSDWMHSEYLYPLNGNQRYSKQAASYNHLICSSEN